MGKRNPTIISLISFRFIILNIQSLLKYPINIISGTTGCIEGRDKFINPPHWSLVRSRNSGYGNIYVNKTHLIWKEYAIIDNKKKLIDHFIIVK